MTGKEKCELLRTIRKDIAEKNNIQYNPGICYHEGDCSGYCPRCDEEAAFLMRELKKHEEAGMKIVIDTKLFDKINNMNKLTSSKKENNLSEIEKLVNGARIERNDGILDLPWKGAEVMIEPREDFSNDDDWA